MLVKIKKLREDAIIPFYAHGPKEDAGMDLRSVEEVCLYPGVPTLVKTGLSIELPPGYEAQIRPRSGLALKYGITVPNSPGTVDPSYRGELGVILLWNGYHSDGALLCPKYYRIERGDRIAQMVVAKYEAVEFLEIGELSDSSRGEGGFGSTGVS